jgi:hypothetical protein
MIQRLFDRGAMRRLFLVVSLLFFVGTNSPAVAMDAARGAALSDRLPLFPADHWWNLDISDWPVDPNSAKYIAFINNGGTRRLHPDFGGDASTAHRPHAVYGMPYAVVSGAAASDLVAVDFYYSSESDGVHHPSGTSFPFYPIPPEAATEPHWIEGGDPGSVDRRDNEDRHLLIVDADRHYLYELYNVYYDAAEGKWYAGSGAFFDMNTNNRRPEGWTSADAAGLAILPGLVRYEEVYDSAVAEIRHALRVTVRSTDGYVYPASHRAGSSPGALPMGARLRLKAEVDVAQRTGDSNVQKIFRAMQKYGLIVADNGSDMYITGTHDPRWDNDILNPAFASLSASDFEVIELGYDPPPASVALVSVSANPSAVPAGSSTVGTVRLSEAAPHGGITINLSSNKPAFAQVPSSVTVPAGADFATFDVDTAIVDSMTSARISASYGRVVRRTALRIKTQ